MGDVSPFLTVPGLPYNSTELQQQFFGMSARDVYALLCKRSGCDAISAVTLMLPEKSGVWDTVELDLSKCYVGHRGIVPLTELCKVLHKLRVFNVRNNFLSNKSIWHLCKMAMFHPSLQVIDISKNDVSWTAGMCVLELVLRNPSITSVNTSETLIKANVCDSIETQIRRNSHIGNRRSRKGPNPTNHPLTIRQRALKRFFRDAVQKEGSVDGKLPRGILIDGCKEALRLAGREKELSQRSPAYFSNFAKRAPTDMVDWECFMLLTMIEEAEYHESLVDELRSVFHKYDPDNAGYVELSDLAAIVELITGAAPTEKEVQSKLAFLAADQSMTVTWDEFLLLMYEHGPVVGELGTLTTQTPLRRAKSQHH